MEALPALSPLIAPPQPHLGITSRPHPEKMAKTGRVDIISEEDSVIFAKTPYLSLTVLCDAEGAATSSQRGCPLMSE